MNGEDRMRVLVIEDNPENSRLVEKVLVKSGFECRLAATAPEGIDMMGSYRPHIVLLDMSLPGMDGWTAAGVIKGNGDLKAVPVVALTAHAMAEDRARALAAGCDAYVTKPFRPAELVETIRKLVS